MLKLLFKSLNIVVIFDPRFYSEARAFFEALESEFEVVV